MIFPQFSWHRLLKASRSLFPVMTQSFPLMCPGVEYLLLYGLSQSCFESKLCFQRQIHILRKNSIYLEHWWLRKYYLSFIECLLWSNHQKAHFAHLISSLHSICSLELGIKDHRCLLGLHRRVGEWSRWGDHINALTLPVTLAPTLWKSPLPRGRSPVLADLIFSISILIHLLDDGRAPGCRADGMHCSTPTPLTP